MDTYDEIQTLTSKLRETRDPEARARMKTELAELAAKLPKRKGEFADADDQGFGLGKGFESRIKALYSRPARTDEERHLATCLDDCLIVGALTKVAPNRTQLWADLMAEDATFRKSMASSDASGWIPESISAELHAAVRLEAAVAGLFRTINMPTPVFNLPVQGSPPRAYLASEQGDSDAETDETKKVTASDLTLSNTATLTARKVAVRCVPTVELDEDSVIAALPLIRSEMVYAMARALDGSIINGRRTGTLDSDVSDAKDTRHWFDGLREIALGASAGNGACVFAAANAGSLQLADLRNMRARMGKYGINPMKDGALLCGPTAYTQLLGLTDANGNQLVLTRDKAGVAATLFEGAIGSLDGWPIQLTEDIREDLNRFGVYDGVTTDSTMMLFVNKKQFVVGQYRTPTLKSKDIIDTDQVSLVMMTRGDFCAYVPTRPACGYVYGIRTV